MTRDRKGEEFRSLKSVNGLSILRIRVMSEFSKNNNNNNTTSQNAI